MAPKEPFKVHSLSKHIEDTKKGLSAEAQYNKRPIGKSKASIKREPGTIDKAIFGNESEDDDSGSSSSGSSDEDGSDFLRKLQASKTSTNATPKRPVKREEIADSDDERRSTANDVTSVESKRPVQSGAPSSDDSSSESESESGSGAKLKSTKGEQKVRANGAPLKTVARSSSGSTSGSDSEEEEEGDESSSDDEPPKKATAAKVKDSTSSDQESSDSASDEESGDESDDESEPAASTKPKPAITSTNGTSTATTSETSSSDESTDDEDNTAAQAKPVATGKSVPDKSSDDASEDSSEEEEDADVSMHIADRQHDRRATVPDFIAPDFVLRKSDGGTNGQDVARICNQANLQGKQVWYFTVPANVPISVVQNMEIPMNQSQSGDSIFSHNGEDYGISVDSMTPKSSIQILIPSSDGTRYQSASRPIDQVMQVKKITQLGQGSGATSSVGPTPKPPARQQPEGLKARYQPYGVTSPMGQIGVDVSFQVENDTEMADAPAPAIPSSSAQSKSDKKERKRKEKEKGESETPRKGKRKHISSEDDAVAATEQLMEENLSAETKAKKQKTERVGSPDLGSDAPPSSAVSKKQTLLVPPAIPGSTPSSKSKSSKSKPQTPAPKPRETAVPVPQVPGSSQLKVSPVPIPQPGVASTPLADRDNKKSKKKKTKTPDATAKTQQSPPPSAQPAGKNSKIKVTPVPMPKLKTTG